MEWKRQGLAPKRRERAHTHLDILSFLCILEIEDAAAELAKGRAFFFCGLLTHQFKETEPKCRQCTESCQKENSIAPVIPTPNYLTNISASKEKSQPNSLTLKPLLALASAAPERISACCKL